MGAFRPLFAMVMCVAVESGGLVSRATEKVLRSIQGAAWQRGGGQVPAKIAEAHRVIAGEPAYADIDNLIEILERFAQDCAANRSQNLVPAGLQMLDEAAASVEEVSVIFGLRHLTVPEPFTLGQVEFCTVPDSAFRGGMKLPPVEVPALKGWRRFLGRHPSRPQPKASNEADSVRPVARVIVRGTDTERLNTRAQMIVDDALRKVRFVTARAGVHPNQLRFGRDGSWSHEGKGRSGWSLQAESPISLALGDIQRLGTVPGLSSSTKAIDLPVLGQQQSPAEKQAAFAMLWLDQAELSSDLLVRTIFPIFAYEALLGDTADGLKARSLVFYRVMLGEVVDGWRPEPRMLYDLYDQVRSAAVHGSLPPLVPDRDLAKFMIADGRVALEEYLSLCQQHGFKKRNKVKEFLRTHPSASEILKELSAANPGVWGGWDPSAHPK